MGFGGEREREGKGGNTFLRKLLYCWPTVRTLTAFCMRPAEMTMAVRLVGRGGIFLGGRMGGIWGGREGGGGG